LQTALRSDLKDSSDDSHAQESASGRSSIEPVASTPLSASHEEEIVANDAFVLFNESEPEVEGIVRQLERFGVSLYFWRRDIQIGEEWIERERKELESARCVLIFLGKAGWGPNHARLAEESLSLNKKIIPVLLAEFIAGSTRDVGGIFTNLRYFDLTVPSPKNCRSLVKRILSLIGKDRFESERDSAGVIVRPVREAALDQGLLNVDQYADVLANLIRTAGNDESLSMAVLAPWGRGKTFLMRLVGSRLEKNHFTTINFSAWKYRTTPEVWSFLYETVLSESSKSGWPVPVRTGLLRHGLWPAVGLLLTVAFSLATISQRSYLVQMILSLFGVMGGVYLFSSTSAVWRAGNVLTSRYWELPRHRDRLGLQFAIGDDLKSLLLGWMPENGKWMPAILAVIIDKPLASLCYCCAIAAFWWTAFVAAVEKAAVNANVGYVVVGILGVVLLIALLPFWAFVRGVDSRRRAVLVVDDLDRCHPDQMLEIIECLQLFLDDAEVKKRLKIVMLVEEQILRNAIQQRYREVVKADADPHSGHQLIGDNLEKLFLVWLRLEPLGEDELEQVFEGVCNSLTKATPVIGAKETQSDANSAGSRKNVATAPQSGQLKAPTQPDEKDARQTTSESLTQEEKAAMLAMVKVIRERSGRKSWGPRAVRSFVFRYQLARMLLERMNIKCDPYNLIEALLVAGQVEPNSVEMENIDETLFRVARQVS
jgi:hypothetical protein